MSTAILIDGGFFLKRHRTLLRNRRNLSPKEMAKDIHTFALRHADNDDVYRVFYYDCTPLLKRVHNPITGKAIDLSKTPLCQFRLELFEELKRLRKVALRLGNLSDGQRWQIHPNKLKSLLKKDITIDELTERDVYYDTKQKSVDMKIGVDIASLSLKKLVDKIVLVSGDTDFVPAAKLARREGIDFILDPMGNHISPDLFEHIDGLHTRHIGPSAKNNGPAKKKTARKKQV